MNEPADFFTKLNIIKADDLSAGRQPITANPSCVPVICISTTLSAGEYTRGAGATEDSTNKKYQFTVDNSIRLVILDDALVARTTPISLWISSGFRAIDHAIESYVSPLANTATEEHARAGLRLLVPSLLRCHTDAAHTDIEARQLAQMGAIEAIAALLRVYTPAGGSHAIGHMLGPFGVAHGETSAILLPAVCAYNAAHGANVARQRELAEELWRIDEFKALAERRGFVQGKAELGELVRALTRELGLPTTLKEAGVIGKDKIELLAEYSLADPWAKANPVPLERKEQVLELLGPIIG